LDWAAVEQLDDEALEVRMYGPAGGKQGDRPEPEVTYIHVELRRPGVTLQLLHLEYLERHPNGYRAELSEASLGAANLRHADLREADLREANLRGSDLSGANLSGANLEGAVLHNVNLSSALLCGAKLRQARCAFVTWADVDISLVVGLDAVVHDGPSTVGIDTLFKSGGMIPDVFLRGCGVPEYSIENQKAILGQLSPIEFYSCFISYSTADEEFAKRLHGRLQQEGLRVWFAPEDIMGGRKLHEQIDDAIRVHDKLLLVLSDASMQSEWVATEISKARKRERKEHCQVLFPIRLVEYEKIRDWECFDADAGKDSAREVREYFIPDFSAWKDHDAFEKAFARLLEDLKKSAEPGARGSAAG
jgi:hypothetical protein